MRTLIIDNYDSFTFNLYQMIAGMSVEAPVVVRNDQLPWQALEEMEFDNVVISPGPGRPERPADIGVSADALRWAGVPVLGVCLGHQALGYLYGGSVVNAPEVMHGRASTIFHDGAELFHGIPEAFSAVRYHSLVVSKELPACLASIAWTADGLVMGLRHRKLPLWGVQFHPESICTEHGRRLLENFMEITARRAGEQRGRPRHGEGKSDRKVSIIPAGRAQAESGEGLEVRSRKLDFHVDAEQAFANLFAAEPRSFWLDSSQREPGLSRFSFMGCGGGPKALFVTYRVDERELILMEGDREVRTDEPIFDYLKRELERRRARSDDLPFDFNCGFVGYLGYELKAECGADAAHRSPLPDAQLLFADRLIAFDHAEETTYLACVAGPGGAGEADAWMDECERALRALRPLTSPAPPAGDIPLIEFRLARNDDTYIADIEECLREIRDGETYEVCLTNRIHADVRVDPLLLHRMLRRASPAPYAAFLRLDGVAIVSSSPERFLRIDRHGEVETKPIKGTLPRGGTPEEDRALRERLQSSEKDRAENLMIVDLSRNDLGIVCEVGSVHVPKLMDVEPYATVHQLVSTVRGRLRPELCAIDCVKAAFPAGSMTGAPKLRTMRIIDRIEGEARGVYSGAIGYLALSGAADLSVVIRSAVLGPEGMSIGVGGAIVGMSDPEAEVEEMLLKGRAVLRAIACAVHGGAA